MLSAKKLTDYEVTSTFTIRKNYSQKKKITFCIIFVSESVIKVRKRCLRNSHEKKTKMIKKQILFQN